jgi:hypothetical protein
MTIDQRKRPALQQVLCPAANASTSELHKIRSAHFNHELTRMNTNSCSRRSLTAASLSCNVFATDYTDFESLAVASHPLQHRSYNESGIQEVRKVCSQVIDCRRVSFGVRC